MKLKYIIGALVVILLLGGGYFFFQQKFNQEQAKVWDFVPEHAVWVYEANELPAVWEVLKEQPAAEILETLPWFARLENYRSQLDSATQNVGELFNARAIHTSLHITGNNSFDYLFYLPVKGVADYNALRDILAAFQDDAAYLYSERVFHGHDIQEFTNSTSKDRFSFLLHKNYFVGSFSPFLVEDVVRQLEASKEEGDYKARHPEIFQLSHMENDQGNLYVNGHRVGALLNLFLKDAYFPSTFPTTSKLDVAFNQDGLLLNGYSTVAEGGHAPYLQSLLHEQPQKLDIAHMLPLSTAWMKFFGFTNGGEWHQKLISKKAVPAWGRLTAAFPLAQELPSAIGNRIVLAGIRTPGEENNHLLYVHTTNGAEADEKMLELAARMGKQEGDSLFRERFGDIVISQIPYREFPQALFGPAFAGFEECFYARFDNYLVFSNSLQALKNMWVDMEADNTWQKSVPVYQFLNKINQEVNFGMYVNTERMWESILANAEPSWKAFMEQHGLRLRQFNMWALQLSSLDDMLYTNLLLQAVPAEVQELRQLRFSVVHETLLGAPAASKPMYLRNNRQGSQHLFVQDTSNILYLMDGQGDITGSDSLDAALVAEVFQLDPQKNNRYQHLFATKQSLYLYSPDFKRQPPFPLSLPNEEEIAWVNVIDYNGSKVYRILVAAVSGSLYMYDLEGNNLEGWQGLEQGGALSAAPGHIRVRGKDCIYAFQKGGVMNVLNRRGEPYDGFPLNLKDSVLGNVFIKPGSDFKNTLFTTITKGGELLSFNLNGQITKQAQLFKPDVNSRFTLVPDEAETSYLIARQSANRMSLLDNKGTLLFEKAYLGAAKVHVQYFNFGADKELIAITDPVEEFTYLYDREGNLLNFEPLNSCCPISIQLSDEVARYNVFKSYDERVSLLKGQE